MIYPEFPETTLQLLRLSIDLPTQPTTRTMAKTKTLYPTESEVLGAVKEELKDSREKFPSNEHQLAAFQEEVGELSQALIEHSLGNCPPGRIVEEAVQAATMAIRVATEGDAAFEYDNPDTAINYHDLFGAPSYGETIFGIQIPEHLADPYGFERFIKALRGISQLVGEGEMVYLTTTTNPSEYQIRRKGGPPRQPPGSADEIIGSGDDLILALQGTVPYLEQNGYVSEHD